DVNEDPDDPRTDEEERLIGAHPDCPATCPEQSPDSDTDINVYYLRDIGGNAVGRAYGGAPVVVVEGPSASTTTLAHEIGHKLIIGWACSNDDDGVSPEHKDAECNLWSDVNDINIMKVPTADDRKDVAQSQVENVLNRARFNNNRHPFVVFEQ
ncbi:MAG: hypothetical protein JSW55_16050, partial [Chloroflexota bacterium]